MRRVSACLALFLLLPVFLFANDQAVARARAALNNEPEAREIQKIGAEARNEGADPNHPGQRSAVGAAVGGAVDIRQMNSLMDQLEHRLDVEARQCHFCSDKQEELSELIRERMALVSSSAQALGHDRAPLIMRVMGVTPTEPTRWSDVQIALREPADAWRSHCGHPGTPDKFCAGGNRVLHLAEEHEKAWADCFNKNDWVETGSKRRAYEACMSATDPIVQMWELDHKSGTGSAPYTDVWYMDVAQWARLRPRQIPSPIGIY
jgi:hypothetical protein